MVKAHIRTFFTGAKSSDSEPEMLSRSKSSPSEELMVCVLVVVNGHTEVEVGNASRLVKEDHLHHMIYVQRVLADPIRSQRVAINKNFLGKSPNCVQGSCWTP